MELTPQQIAKMVDQKVSGIAAAAARASYVGTKMSDLPEAYKNMMPLSADQGQLAEAEANIRRSFRDDMKTHGPIHAASLGWTPPPGSPAEAQQKANAAAGVASPLQGVDLSHLDSAQLILLGLRNSRPAQRGR